MDEDVGLVKAPRICEMICEDIGYGFNLHGEKGVIGQYISAIDKGGAADKSGLYVGDRVVEVNGVNVESFSHSEVVGQIRSDPVKAVLLVVDKITDAYLKKINRPVTASLSSYTDVHEMTIEEAEKLKELRLKDTAEIEEDDRVEEEEKQGTVEDITVSTAASTSISESDLVQQEIDTSSPPSIQNHDSHSSGSDCHPEEEEVEISPEAESIAESEEILCARATPPEVQSREMEPKAPKETNPSPPPVERSGVRNAKNKETLTDSVIPDIMKESKNDIMKESKNDMLKKIIKTPKRKEVKHKNTDWKSKLNEFNNL